MFPQLGSKDPEFQPRGYDPRHSAPADPQSVQDSIANSGSSSLLGRTAVEEQLRRSDQVLTRDIPIERR